MLISTRQFSPRLRSLAARYRRGLWVAGTVLVLALLFGEVHRFQDRWVEVDAQQWNRWFPSGQVPEKAGDQTADEHPRYTSVRYRIERDYDHGREVRKGQKIATMGSTGTDRVQLYFEIRRRDRRVSPADYLNGR